MFDDRGTREPTYSWQHSNQGTLIRIELPGVASEHLTLDIKGRRLTLNAKRYPRKNTHWDQEMNVDEGAQYRKQEDDHKDGAVQVTEGTEKAESGRDPELMYSKVFHLPDAADVDNIDANYRDGLLEIFVAGRAKDSTRSIKVN